MFLEVLDSAAGPPPPPPSTAAMIKLYPSWVTKNLINLRRLKKEEAVIYIHLSPPLSSDIY